MIHRVVYVQGERERERESGRGLGAWSRKLGFLFLSVLGKWNGNFVTAPLVKKGDCVLSIDSALNGAKQAPFVVYKLP